MWNDTPASEYLGVKYPIVQGPFGGGPSSVVLACAVSNAGGLGSYGMQSLEPGQMARVAQQMRAGTDKPFAINLWMPKDECGGVPDDDPSGIAVDFLKPYYDEVGVAFPEIPDRLIPDIDEQLSAMLDIRPPVFSFVFGVPPVEVLKACWERRILTIGTATTVEEAQMLEAAGVACIVVSSFEAGGHKGAFLKSAEDSLIGMFALLPQVADAVRVPVIAAGGIADARGIAAAFALGAHGVQIGTAFLACNESGANPLHRAALLSGRARDTALTKVFSGRLARSIRNRFLDEVGRSGVPIPSYPVEGWFTGALATAAIEQGRADLISLSAGQAAGLIRHRSAADLMDALIRETPGLLARMSDSSRRATCAP